MRGSAFPHRQHQQGQKLPEQQLSLKPADSLGEGRISQVVGLPNCLMYFD